MKLAAISVVFLAATVALAQGPKSTTGVDVRVGYGFSPSFATAGGSHTIQGFDVGVGLPLGSFLGGNVLIEPSFLAGGGSDVYRLTAFYHRVFARGVGGRIGVGYSNSTRHDDIEGRSGAIFDFGVEIPFEFKLIQAVEPYADIHGVVSSENRLSGVFFGVGVRI